MCFSLRSTSISTSILRVKEDFVERERERGIIVVICFCYKVRVQLRFREKPLH